MPFTIDSSNGTVYVSLPPNGNLDYETTSKYEEITVSVQDSNGLTNHANYVINIVDINEPVLFDEDFYEFSVPEDSVIGTTVGNVHATDSDHDDTLIIYTIIGGNDENKFSLDSFSGEITVNNMLDYEDIDEYILSIQVTDNVFTDTRDVKIIIIDIVDITINSVLGVDLSTNGNDTIIITGTNFGKKSATDTNVFVTFGPSDDITRYTAVGCLVTFTNTEIMCYSPPGIGFGYDIVVSINYVNITAFDGNGVNIAYSAPNILNVNGALDISTEGNDTITISGTNFGPISTTFSDSTPLGVSWVKYISGSTLQNYIATDCKVLIPNEEIQCKTVAGIGSNLRWQVSIGGLHSNVIEEGRYGAPIIQLVTVDGSNESQIPTTGILDYPVKFQGENFGNDNGMITAFYHTENSIHGVQNCLIVIPHKTIECTSLDEGVGNNFEWKVSVGEQSSSWKTSQISFASPSITMISGAGAQNAFTVGGQIVVLTGNNFGPKNGIIPQVFYGKSSTEYTATECNVLSHTKIQCLTAPGTGAGHSWKVSIAGQMSPILNADTNYRPPSISRFTNNGAEDANTEGGQLVTIHGTNFGPIGGIDQVSVEAFYGLQINNVEETFTASNCFVSVSHTEVQCITAEGAGSGLTWTLQIDDQESETATTSYAEPVITAVSIMTHNEEIHNLQNELRRRMNVKNDQTTTHHGAYQRHRRIVRRLGSSGSSGSSGNSGGDDINCNVCYIDFEDMNGCIYINANLFDEAAVILEDSGGKSNIYYFYFIIFKINSM